MSTSPATSPVRDLYNEPGAAAEFALDAYFAAHQLHQFGHDGQAEPCSSVLTISGAFACRKGSKITSICSGVSPMPVSSMVKEIAAPEGSTRTWIEPKW